MRLWSLHPRYLDPQGLVALWREALLARAVLREMTKGYRRHPQLTRFRGHAQPRVAISAYLAAIADEADARGYRFDRSKIGPLRRVDRIVCTDGQLALEWRHLLRKLEARNPALHQRWQGIALPQAHPLFEIVPGPPADWEKSDPSAIPGR